MEQLPIEIDQTMDVRKSEVTEIVPTNFSKLGMYFIYYEKYLAFLLNKKKSSTAAPLLLQT